MVARQEYTVQGVRQGIRKIEKHRRELGDHRPGRYLKGWNEAGGCSRLELLTSGTKYRKTANQRLFEPNILRSTWLSDGV